jgi:hypothetical protein
MASTDWMKPVESDELEFELHRLGNELRNEVTNRGPDAVIVRCLLMARLISIQEIMIRRAGRRIAELEVALAAASQASIKPRRRLWPWPTRPRRQ